MECCGKNGEKLSVGRRRLLNPNFARSKILLEIPLFVFATSVQECFRPARASLFSTNQRSWLELVCNNYIVYGPIGEKVYSLMVS